MQVNSFVSGFTYHINNLTVEMNLTPFVMGPNQSYQILKYKDRYYIALVRFTLSMDGRIVIINIPFYTSYSMVGAGTWFPFHCCSQGTQADSIEYYYRSEYGDSYIFKMGHYYPEPFSVRHKDISRDAGIRNIMINIPQIACNRQRNFIIEQTQEIPKELLYSDLDTGVHTILLRFANLLYLTASYFLFGNNTGWNPANFLEGTPEKAFAGVLNRIGSQASFGGKTWNEIVVTLPRTPFNLQNCFLVETGNVVNYLLAANNVPMPHYQEISRLDNGLDAKFVTCMKLLQGVGELYLDPNSFELKKRFKAIFDRAVPVINIPLITQDQLIIGKDFYVWLIPESFSGKNNLVRLYRFM